MRYFSAQFLIAFAFIKLATAAAADSATIPVNSTSDDFDQPDNGNCTLREAILAANTNTAVDGCPSGAPGPGTVDQIVVPAGIHQLTIGPRGDDVAERGDLDLTDDIEIVGAGANTTQVDATELDRIFHIHSGITASISGLALRNGNAGSDNGGGINNNGNLVLDQVEVSANFASGSGGGIRNNSQLTVHNSLLDANITLDHGGGIDNHGDAIFSNSTVSGNDGSSLGGGLYNLGGMELTMTHCTVQGNSADAGGAIHNAGTLMASNNLIVGPCSGQIDVSGGGNLESPGNTCGLGTNDNHSVSGPRLGPLGANGGATRTHPLLAASPAIDTAASGPCTAEDQRGVARPIDGDGDSLDECDIGAFEAAENTMAPEIFIDDFETGDASAWQ